MSLSWFAAAAPVNVTLPDLPSTTSIQEQLNQLGKREALTVSEKAKREDLEKTLALLENIDKEKDKLKNQQKMLEAAPAKLQQYNAELDRLRKPADSDKLAKQLDQLPINQLDKRLTSAMGELQQAQEELAAADRQLLRSPHHQRLHRSPERHDEGHQPQRARLHVRDHQGAHAVLQQLPCRSVTGMVLRELRRLVLRG